MPKPNAERRYISLPPALNERLKAHKARTGAAISSTIQIAVKQYLDRFERGSRFVYSDPKEVVWTEDGPKEDGKD